MDPEEVEGREFLVTLRGYSRDEVDAFKAEVAENLRNLAAELTESTEELRAVKGQLEEALAHPARQGPGAEQGSKEEAAAPDRELAFKQVAQETERILMAAEQVAEQIHERARQESAEILTDARRQAQHGFDQVEETKRRAERDLDGIRESRGLIASQLEDIRRRLDETINRLRIPVESPVTPVRPRGYRERAAQDTETPAAASEGQSAPAPATARASVPTRATAAAPDAAEQERQRKLKEIAERQARELAERHGQEQAGAAEAALPEAEQPEDQGEAARIEPSRGALDELLEEFRRKRAGETPSSHSTGSPGRPPAPEAAAARPPRSAEPAEETSTDLGPLPELEQRTEALGDLPNQSARRLKRLLQEEHNDILDRLRTRKARKDAEQIVATSEEQLARFVEGLGQVLGDAFREGRRAAGGTGDGNAQDPVRRQVTRQVVKPLRSEVIEAIQAGLDAEDSPSAVAERASDVFRVWKGVRTEMLGEGMAYAAYHQGIVDCWASETSSRKVWVLAEEDECPGDVCARNAGAGPLEPKAAFPSGHILPPAHGGCLCTLGKASTSKSD